jgi:probable DNA metabolism protein
MIYYIYDGTFEGLLTVVAEALNSSEEVNGITAAGASIQPDLFTEMREIAAEPGVAFRLMKRLRTEAPRPALLDIGYCFLSEEPGIELAIFSYIRLIFTKGGKTLGNFADPTVLRIRRTSDRVTCEIHRLHGFIRFRKLAGGFYYSPIEPDHNVVQFLAPHFTARFADQRWLIHDLKRNTGIYYDGERCRFLPRVEIDQGIQEESGVYGSGRGPARMLEADEMDYQKLWDEYFRRIAITERRNPRAQRQRMPARYWRYLVEDVAGFDRELDGD